MNPEFVELSDHLDPVYREWLLARREDNQRTSLRLHSVIRTHASRISESDDLVRLTQNLVSAAASLWRAASLSDRIAIYDDVEDEDFFLTDGIIQKEFVVEPAARAAPDWAFVSHMNRARAALIAIKMAPEPKLLAEVEMPPWVGLSYKDSWLRHQHLLDLAVGNFEAFLNPRA